MTSEYFQHQLQTDKTYPGYTFKNVTRQNQNTLYYFSNESFPENKTYYLKIFSNEPDEMGELPDQKAMREVTVSKLLQGKIGIHSPDTIYIGKDDSGYSALLQEEIRGVSFDTLINGDCELSREELNTIAYETGSYLSKIHEITSQFYGEVSDDSIRLTNLTDYFTQNIVKRFNTGLYKGILNQNQVDYFYKRLSNLPDKSANPPTPCHNDFTPQSIIINPDSLKIEGFIDFEMAKFLVPEWDLTRVNVIFEYPYINSELRDNFFFGYCSAGRMDIADVMSLIDYYKPFEGLNY